MAIEIKAIDLTLMKWLMRNAHERLDRDAGASLNKAVEHFAVMSGRLGHYIGERGINHVVGLFHHDKLLKSLQVSSEGTLHGRIETADESVSWQSGQLTLLRKRHPLPATLIGAFAGRPLREIVDADWLAEDARVVEISENRIYVILHCDHWIIPLEDARTILMEGSATA